MKLVLFAQSNKSTCSVPIKFVLYKVNRLKEEFFTLIDFFKPLDIQGTLKGS